MAIFRRFDLTREKRFTLSEATVSTLHDLRDPLTIRAYFTKDLPPPHSTQARYVKDLLDEYYASGRGKVRFEFIDPVAAETSAEKDKKKDVKQDIFGRQVREATSMEMELQAIGIPPVQVRVNEADKLEVKRAYMGIAVLYGERKEVIPVVSDTAGLEYDLTTLIRKLAREKTTKVAFVSGHEEPDLEKDLSRAASALREMYEVTTVDAKQPIADDISALLIVGPKTAFSDDEKRHLDTFITSGHAAAFFVGPIKPDLQTLQSEDNNAQLGDLLASYGVVPTPGLVVDAECATINVSQQAGFMRVNQAVRYPLMPLPRSLEHHNLTRGLTQVAFPFSGPVAVNMPTQTSMKAEVLVRTSEKSWIADPPYFLDPMQQWTPPDSRDAVHEQNLIVSLSGPIKSFYPPANGTTATGSEAEARLIIAGTSSFITDPFYGKPAEALLLNFVDWMVHDDALLAVRSRGLAAAPLRDVSEAIRRALKLGNIVGLPAAFIGFGLVRWRRREARRDQVRL